MASYEYHVVTIGETGTEVIVQPSCLHNVPCERWTSATASEYARLRRHAVGTRIVVTRRRPTKGGTAPWSPHRAYLVDEDGIVRRTDR